MSLRRGWRRRGHCSIDGADGCRSVSAAMAAVERCDRWPPDLPVLKHRLGGGHAGSAGIGTRAGSGCRSPSAIGPAQAVVDPDLGDAHGVRHLAGARSPVIGSVSSVAFEPPAFGDEDGHVVGLAVSRDRLRRAPRAGGRPPAFAGGGQRGRSDPFGLGEGALGQCIDERRRAVRSASLAPDGGVGIGAMMQASASTRAARPAIDKRQARIQSCRRDGTGGKAGSGHGKTSRTDEARLRLRRGRPGGSGSCARLGGGAPVGCAAGLSCP